MNKCGRCKGRGYVNAIRGVGHIDCPKCKGRGVFESRSRLGARTVSVPLGGAMCIVCGDRPAVHNHHVITQERLDRYVTPERVQQAKADPRNVTPLCAACHDAAHTDRLRLQAHELHPDFHAFVYEYDLFAALPRYMSEVA